MIVLIAMIFICSQTHCRQLRQENKLGEISGLDLEELEEPSLEEQSLQSNSVNVQYQKSQYTESSDENDLEEGNNEAPIEEEDEEVDIKNLSQLLDDFGYSPLTEFIEENDLEEDKNEAPSEEDADNLSQFALDLGFDHRQNDSPQTPPGIVKQKLESTEPLKAFQDEGSKKDGDNSKLALSLVLVAVVIAALVVGIIVVRRRKTNDRHGYQAIEMTTTTTKMD